MAWVKTFSEEEAKGRLAEVYDELRSHPMTRGSVPNIIKSMGPRPEAMLRVWKIDTVYPSSGHDIGYMV